MEKSEKLISKYDNKVTFVDINYSPGAEWGKYVDNTIFINKNMNEKQKLGILAEELGHYKTTCGNITDQTKVENKKQEFRARRLGYRHVVSLEGIIEAFENNCLNKYEVAEYLGVTDKYFEECIEDYKRQYGVFCILDKYHIVFEPRLGIYKKII